ncbi:sialidase family protein [Verrucomicrobiota bacterium sgz303538]
MRPPKFPRLASVAALLAACMLAHAADPLVEKSDLFQGGKDGYALYRIPGIVVTSKGTALAYCESRQKNGADWGHIDVHLRRSVDGGKTWEPARQIAHLGDPVPRNPVVFEKKLGTENERTVNNPVAIVDRQSGAVHFLYCVDYGRCFHMRSEDDGLTFSKPVEITSAFEKFRPEYDWKVIATGPGHGIQLKNGRLVVPVWLSLGHSKNAHHPSVASVIYSDDHGQTWNRGDIAVPNTAECKDPNETTIVELVDGRVMLNTRSQSAPNRRLIVTSPDGATQWTQPRFDDALLEPVCMASLTRLTLQQGSDKNRILFANPHNVKRDAEGKEIPGAGAERRNLSVKLSYDEGQSWPVNKTLEEGGSMYSDLAVLPDGTALCFYERKNLLTLARFNLEWLTDGRDSLPEKRSDVPAGQ